VPDSGTPSPFAICQNHESFCIVAALFAAIYQWWYGIKDAGYWWIEGNDAAL